MDNETALQTEGIFRRSANVNTVKEVQQLFNSGQSVQFETYGDSGYKLNYSLIQLKENQTIIREKSQFLTMIFNLNVMQYQNCIMLSYV